MKRNLAVAVILLTFILSARNGFGQNDGSNADLKEIKAYSLNGAQLDLDGKVDEEFWLSIPGSGGFRMQEPIEGGQPTQKTEIRIAFDKENLYIAAIMYDSDPSGIKAFQKKR